MAKNDNLQDFLTDIANSIRTKTQTTDPINAQDFSDKILNISSGGNTLKNLLDATKNCYYLFQEYSGVSVDDLIQPNDTENVTTMSNMFYNCANLTTIPQLNTGKVTTMNSMFYNCSKLTTIPPLNISNVTSVNNMFYNCNSLTTVPQLDTSNVTEMSKMFYGCSKLTTVPLYDTSKVTRMEEMFWHCSDLQTVPALECTNVTNMNNIFASCHSLKSILMTNIGVSLNISASTLFERSDLLVILNNLKTVTSSKVLTMGATNLAKLTDEDKAIATNKG